ncbi:MAG TPA: sn-glycerol-3-phosphate ABC transporter permease UgpA [Trueperaceae bacterium]
MSERSFFKNRWLPYWLLLPQLLITAVFFLWPAGKALLQSVQRQDAWGLNSSFVGLANFFDLFRDDLYLQSFGTTLIFSVAVTLIALAGGLLFAACADFILKGSNAYRSLLMWPYAVAPAIAGALWYFMFNPSLGIIANALEAIGYDWNHALDGGDALLLVIMASAWRQIGYNFLFFLAGLQAVPNSVIEAAAIDGAAPVRRFWAIIFPLLSPITFFLIVLNTVYSFFDTFGVIHATTQGGPIQATSILVYKVYETGFLSQDLGGSAAQSVVLMTMVIALTFIQFRYLGARVHY